MGFLKVFSAKPPLYLIKTNCNAKFCTNVSQKLSDLDTINMSYATYENTQAMTREIAPPLVVMHGLFGSKRNWNSLCKVFHRKTNPQRKVVAVDARNHGESPHCSAHTYQHMAEDIRSLLLQLNIKKTALLGHSMGGRAMMYFALRYPEMVDKLIVADVSPVSTSPKLNTISSIFTAVQEIALPRDVPISAARLICDLQLSNNITNKGLRAFLLTNLVQKANGSYMWRINIPALLTNFTDYIARFPDVSDFKFNGPVLFVAGGMSDYIPKSDHAQILDLFPKAEFQEIEGAGHWVHSEKPIDFLQLCIQFLNKTATGSEGVQWAKYGLRRDAWESTS